MSLIGICLLIFQIGGQNIHKQVRLMWLGCIN